MEKFFVVLAVISFFTFADSGRKIKLTVLPYIFTTEMTGIPDKEQQGIRTAVTEKITARLASMERFEYIDPHSLRATLDSLASLGLYVYDDSLTARLGRSAGADLIVTGSVDLNSAAYEEHRDGKPVYKARVSISTRLVDPSTSRLQREIDVAESGRGGSKEDARSAALDASVDELIETIVALYPISARIVEISGSEIRINVGRTRGVRFGQFYSVIGQDDSVTGEVAGRQRRPGSIVAIIKITHVKENFSRAKIVRHYSSIAVGDNIRETRAGSLLAASFGYCMTGGSQQAATSAEPVLYKNYGYYSEDPDTLVPDFSGYEPFSYLSGVFFSFDFYRIRYSNFFGGFQFAFPYRKNGISSILLDWRLGYEIPLVKDRLLLPIGIGATVGRLRYSINYTQELQSQLTDYRVGVEHSNASDVISASTYGATAFGGLRFQVHKHIGMLLNAGYRRHVVVDSWEATYDVKEWNEDTQEYVDVQKELSIPQKWLPYRDVRISGFDLRAGVYWLW